LNRERSLDELIGAEATGAERERLQQVHELLLQAGPPPELSPELEAGPTLQMTLQRKRRKVKPRAMMLLAAALVLVLVFIGGYAAGNSSGSKHATAPVSVKLAGTSRAPNAHASLEVWHRSAGNWPMTLSVVGLKKLPAHRYYEVYLVRNGKPWGSCGTFRVTSTKGAVRVTLNAPYSLRKGDSWIVTRPGASGAEPGQTVLHPVTA
jgi:Anti-sigma-K factor rskA